MKQSTSLGRKPAGKYPKREIGARGVFPYGMALIGLSIAAALLTTPAEAQIYTASVALQCNEAVEFSPHLGYLNVISVPASTDPGVAQGSGSRGNPRSKGRHRPGGTDGSITITAGDHAGNATITYMIENFSGETAGISIAVDVTCPPKKKKKAETDPRQNHQGPGRNEDDGRPPKKKDPPPHLTVTHRGTHCAACQEIAADLNGWIDFYNSGQEDFPGILFIIRNLARELDDCEKKCPPPVVVATEPVAQPVERTVIEVLKLRPGTTVPLVPPVIVTPPEPRTDVPAEPKIIAHSKPKTVAHTEPKSVIHTERNTIVHTEPKSVIHTERNTIVHTEPKTVVHTEPKTIVHTEPKTIVHTEPKAVVRVEPKTVMHPTPKIAVRPGLTSTPHLSITRPQLPVMHVAPAPRISFPGAAPHGRMLGGFGRAGDTGAT